jgi:hypothetical protein
MNPDILYVAFNRLEMSRESFSALLANTNWSRVNCLYVHDDGSTDGTQDYLKEATESFNEAEAVFHGERLLGPVAATNWYLDLTGSTPDTFAKIDNDFVVCPTWLDCLLDLHHRNPNFDLYGIEPMMGNPKISNGRRHTLTEARHIGGKGLIRKRAFERSGCRPHAHGKNGYQGFTQWQTAHESVLKAWVTPDLPCFGLDQLPFEPWTSLTASYVEKEWQRFWPPYSEDATSYWEWWLRGDKNRKQS